MQNILYLDSLTHQRRPPIRSQAMSYLKINNEQEIVGRTESLPIIKTSLDSMQMSFSAYFQERSNLGKLINGEYIQKETEFFNGIQERRNLSVDSYVPPNYQLILPLHKQKISLAVAPSRFTKLVKKNGIHFFERGRIKASGTVKNSFSNSMNKNKIRLNFKSEDLEDTQSMNAVINITNSVLKGQSRQMTILGNSQRNLSNITMSHAVTNQFKDQSSQGKINTSKKLVDSTLISQKSSFSQQTIFQSNCKGKRTQALIQKVLQEEKAIEGIYSKKGVKLEQEGSPVNQKRLQILMQQQEKYNDIFYIQQQSNHHLKDGKNTTLLNIEEKISERDEQIKQISERAIDQNLKKQYLESEEYFLKFFNLNLNVQQRSEYSHSINKVKKIKLPHLQLKTKSVNQFNPPSIGFYTPQHDFIKKKVGM